MAEFQYKARNRAGGLVSGVMEAPNKEMVGLELGRQGHFPVSITASGGSRDINLNVNLDQYLVKIRTQDLVLFSRQMATLFRAGVPLLSVIASIMEQIDNIKFKQVLEKMLHDIQDGLSLSDAMERHPDVFSELYVSMIRAGEAGGIMDEILARLANLLEKQAENEAKVKAALRYPKIVVGLMVAAVFFLMWKVVPVFVRMFETVNLELPLATQILIAANTIFLQYWYLPLIGLLGLAGLFKKYTATTQGRFQWDRLKLKMPLIGPIVLRSSMSKFARVFGNLQRAGVPILDALKITTRVVDNVVIADVINKLHDSVQEGLGLAPTLKKSGWVPALVIQMVAVGEESGSLEEMLVKIADYYDQEVDRAVSTLTAMIEPILIVFIGALVLFLALAIYLPMWDLSQMARPGG